MKVLTNRSGDGDADETRLAAEETRQPAAAPRSSSSGVTPTTGSLSSSGIDHGRFTPGTILGDRYRIVGKLGKGGMGEVFRADDLKLGQQVALKFLPSDVDRDPVRLTQLHTEVRMARQVSHPNVCRVYDIDEIDGHTFLSMEYVDGEDLASLLRRIGRFNEERGLEIARQICAGLAAAHERGVIHRDFKPANVMLDGAGHVRITDFGLAGASGETIRAGTPAYMAPEQIAGAEVTGRSDVYALGLVLYEIFTGKRAIEAATLAELINRREQEEILPPSSIAHVSPEIDRAVMRCLAVEPASRPPSAFAVAAALPGGDPLAAAIAAGETPSPDMVAAAGEEGALSARHGIALLSLTVLGLAIVALISDRTLFVNRASFTKSADVLIDRAREILARAGYTDTPVDTARGVAVNMEYVRWLASTDNSPSKWESLGDGRGPLLDFWYRTSPVPLRPLSLAWAPEWNDPPPDTSGMATVVVDDRGRLVELLRVPPQHDTSPPVAATPDWTPLFEAAGLQLAQFSEVAPQWTPRTFAEQRTAWEGPMPRRPEVRLRVEAASYRGQPVAFKVIGPWTTPARMDYAQPSGFARAASAVSALIILLLLVGAILLVRANTKSNRADRRGARRIALFLITAFMAAWVVGASHTADVDEEFDHLLRAVAVALLNVGATWLFYLALEPFVRRLSPDLLIGWTRLLRGEWRDARVGRDVFVGVATGVVSAAVISFVMLVPTLTGSGSLLPLRSDMSYFLGVRYALADMLLMLPNSLQNAMIGAFCYVVMLALVRRRWIAAVAVCAVVLMGLDVQNPWIALLITAVLGALLLFVFLRFGLLTLASALYVFVALVTVPMTIDPSQPHAPVSLMTMLIVTGIGIYAFTTSRAGENLFRRLARQF